MLREESPESNVPWYHCDEEGAGGVTAKVVERRGPSEETEEVKTYAAAVQGGPRVNAPGNQSGPYGPGRGYGNEAWPGATVPSQAPDDWRTGPPRGSYAPLV